MAMDRKSQHASKAEDKAKKEPPPSTTKASSSSSSPPRTDPPTSAKQPPDGERDAKRTGANADATNKPLAPPPRPNPEGTESSSDYFQPNKPTSHYSLEPNLFEQSFGKPPDTQGKSILPPVASLTSPAPLTGNASLGGGYDWGGSLRSGPLSPAMLSGPTGPGDYFDSSLRGSFPTPNESSLRTGLTPGGGGSMFPAPSPNSQALFQSLASGGATPNTLDFHRTAMNAAAANKSETNVTSVSRSTAAPAATVTTAPTSDTMSSAAPPPPAASHANFASHDNEAANGLYLLAQAGNESQATQPFTPANQPANGDKANKRGRAGVAPGPPAAAVHDGADDSDGDAKPSSKKAKKGSAAKGSSKAKKDDLPRGNARRTKSIASEMDFDEDGDDDEDDGGDDMEMTNGRKMTDEEKRKNFLERNRVAALKCRQRKKQWLANLQAKVEIFSSENDALNAQVNSLREEILNLKTILIAHKDCPIAQQQQLGQYVPQHPPEYNQPNPYGMQMQPGQPVMAGPRRYS